jgi:5-methylcytosine-specific restriction endonuclease McrA
MQTCNKCKRELPDNRYSKHGKSLRRVCKDCELEYLKNWRKNNPKKQSAMNKRAIDKMSDTLLYSYRASAKKRNDKRYTTTLTVTELHEIVLSTKVCPICGVELDYKRGKKHGKDNSPSLDRINNDNIVTKDNVWIICNRCNRTKSDRTLKEFTEYCSMVASKYSSQFNTYRR